MAIQNPEANHPGALGKLLPGQIDVAGRTGRRVNVPKMGLQCRPGLYFTASNLKLWEKPLHHSSGGIALAQCGVAPLMGSEIGGAAIPACLQRRP
jgi:hypothetical protein